MALHSTPHSEEDDLGRPHFVRFDDEYTPTDASSKGKEREITPSPAHSDEPDAVAYPPISEDAEETRRVEENLRRWEIAERQRRKAARGSSTSSATSPSLVGDISRRASALWTGRKSRGASLGGVGTHAALQSQDDNIDTVPLTHINNSPSPSPTRSESDEPSSNNPFAAPEDSLHSPFADSQQIASTRLHPSSTPSNTLQNTKSLSTSTTQIPPPPQPLNLPPPRTPPPIVPSSPSASTPSLENRDDDTKEVRWWHDWLCGCGEGPDRGGDNQAGRTNPFE